MNLRPAVICLGLACWLVVNPESQAAHVNVIELDNRIISPVTQQYITDAIERSEDDGAVCLIVKLDTPGGLLESTRAKIGRASCRERV